jgi:hypothetical protein
MNSTITTVLSTADKIKEKKDEKYCKFCLDYRDEVYNNLEIGSIDKMNDE